MNLRIIIENEEVRGNEDIVGLSFELFEVLFPVLLINNSYSLIFENEEIVKVITRGIAVVDNEEIRNKLVYLIFLLCVIE